MSHQKQVVRTLIPFTIANFLGFLAVGIPLPVLSIYVRDVLGFSPVVVGCIISLQSVAPDALWEASDIVADIQEAYDLAAAA